MTTGPGNGGRTKTDRGIEPGPAQRWRPPSRALDPGLVLRLAGYRRLQAVTPPVGEAARRMAERAGALATPEAWWRAVPVMESGEASVRLGPEVRFSGRAVSAHLVGCRLAVAFALTIGAALENEAVALGEAREPLDAFLLDTAGWASIEVAVRALRLELRARVRGGRLTHRLAPGYADWPLEEQPRLLELLAPAPLPVRLNEHGVLVPFKSVTGLFGVAAS